MLARQGKPHNVLSHAWGEGIDLARVSQ